MGAPKPQPPVYCDSTAITVYERNLTLSAPIKVVICSIARCLEVLREAIQIDPISGGSSLRNARTIHGLEEITLFI